MVLSDAFITQETFVDGAKVTFQCAIGYASTGRSPPVTCTAGVWSEVKLKCERNILVIYFCSEKLCHILVNISSFYLPTQLDIFIAHP
jgi:hypothetical protein